MKIKMSASWFDNLVLHVRVGDGEVALHVEGNNAVQAGGEGNTGGWQ